MPTLLTVDTASRDDGALVLTAAGEIDLSNIDTFTEALAAATAETAERGGTLTLDLSEVDYLDSAAINALFTHAEHIHVIADPRLIRVFTITGLSELTTVEPAPPKAAR